MLERIEKILDLNNIVYESDETKMYIKLGGLCSKIKIRYDYATNNYKVNCSEIGLFLSSIILFCLAFNTLYQPTLELWSGYLAGLIFALAIGNLFFIVLTHIQLLDLRAQLREEGIYLKIGL